MVCLFRNFLLRIQPALFDLFFCILTTRRSPLISPLRYGTSVSVSVPGRGLGLMKLWVLVFMTETKCWVMT